MGFRKFKARFTIRSLSAPLNPPKATMGIYTPGYYRSIPEFDADLQRSTSVNAPVNAFRPISMPPLRSHASSPGALNSRQSLTVVSE